MPMRKAEGRPPPTGEASALAVNTACRAELCNVAGLSRGIASRFISARNDFLNEELGIAGRGEEDVWLELKCSTVEDFVELLKKHGLAYFGEKKVAQLKAASVYFAKRNLNSLNDEELQDAFSSVPGIWTKLKERMEDEANPEGWSSQDELLAISDQVEVREALCSSLKRAALYVSPRSTSNLNDNRKWTQESLEALKGVGPAKAHAIVRRRSELPDGFQSWNDIEDIKGVGPTVVKRLIRCGAYIAPIDADEEALRKHQAEIQQKVEKIEHAARKTGEGILRGKQGVQPRKEPEASSRSSDAALDAGGMDSHRSGGSSGAPASNAGPKAVSKRGRMPSKITDSFTKVIDAERPSGNNNETGGRKQLSPDSQTTEMPDTVHPETREDRPSKSADQQVNWWWQQDGCEQLPFPREFVDCEDGDTCCYVTDATPGKPPKNRRPCACSSGRFVYRMTTQSQRQSVTEEERKRLREKYPKISTADPACRETVAFRSKQTGSKAVRDRVWRELLDYEATDRIPKKWRGVFRSDPYGNVVSIDASNMALCAFEVDHIFPWSRGGLSVADNFMALYWGANRHVKNDEIVNGFSAGQIDKMQCGLSVDLFLELIGELEQEDSVAKRTRFKHAIKDMLCTCIALPWNAKSVIQPGLVSSTLINFKRSLLDDLRGGRQ